MDPGGISVERTLPIDGALLGEVLLRLRRDSAAPALRWTLGNRGAAEVDVCFTSAGTAWTTTARLWNHSGLAVAAARLQLEAPAPTRCASPWNHLPPAAAGVTTRATSSIWRAPRSTSSPKSCSGTRPRVGSHRTWLNGVGFPHIHCPLHCLTTDRKVGSSSRRTAADRRNARRAPE